MGEVSDVCAQLELSSTVQVQGVRVHSQLDRHDDVLCCGITCDGLLGAFALPTRLVLRDQGNRPASCMSRIGVAERAETLDAPPQKKARPTGTAQAQRGEVVDVNVEEKQTDSARCLSVRET